MSRHVTAQRKWEVTEHAREHTVKECAFVFGYSRTAIKRWCDEAGITPKPDRIGAPEGNLNMLGGRILNTRRATIQCPHHSRG